jgi:chromosome segregation ATPase
VDPLEIEDTRGWLACSTELETITHYKLMLENEVQELNLQLRTAPENIFGLVKMYDEASAQRDEAVRNLRERSGQLAKVRKELYDLDIAARGCKREVEQLRGILDRITPQPKTIL